MSGRAETQEIIPGQFAISVGLTEMPAPPGWIWVKLQDVARLESGHTPSREHPEYWGGEIGWIGIKDGRVHHGGIIERTIQTVTLLGLENSASRLLPAQTVCLSRTASVGYVIMMGKPMATSQDFVNWTCSEAIEPRFLLHLLVAEKQSLLRFGRGSTHTTIYFPEVKAFHVCLPPVEQQRRLVKKVETLKARTREARETLEEVPELIKQYRQSILAAAFRGDLTADWRASHPDAEPATVLLDRIRQERRRRWEAAELARMKSPPRADRWKAKYQEPAAVDDSDLPELPDGWAWTNLEEISSLITSGSRDWSKYYGRGTDTFIMAQNVRPGRLDFTVVRQRVDPPASDRDRERSQVRVGDLLFTIVGASTGDVCPVVDELPGHYVCQSVALVRLCLPATQGWVLRYFLSAGAGRKLLDEVIYGQGRPHLGFDDLKRLPIPLAPLAEQTRAIHRIAAYEASTDAVTSKVEAAREELGLLDQAILSKAFRGELVPQDPDDEPASALLDRIRAERQAEGKGRSARSRQGRLAGLD